MGMEIIKLDLPLFVRMPPSKRKPKGYNYILNLNVYRNTNRFTLSKVKKAYGQIVTDLIYEQLGANLTPIGDIPVQLYYRYFKATKRLVDVSNPCSVIDKFCCDALVHSNLIIDDNTKYVNRVIYEYGGMSKSNPRCELTISTCKW